MSQSKGSGIVGNPKPYIVGLYSKHLTAGCIRGQQPLETRASFHGGLWEVSQIWGTFLGAPIVAFWALCWGSPCLRKLPHDSHMKAATYNSLAGQIAMTSRDLISNGGFANESGFVVAFGNTSPS